MKPIYCLVLIPVLLASCSVLTQNTQPVPNKFAGPVITLTPLATITPFTTPFSTLTPNQITNLDLESILIQPGDLPEGYTGGQISQNLPEYYDRENTPVPLYQIYQEIRQNNDNAGGVTVMVHNSQIINGKSIMSQAYRMEAWGNFQNLGNDSLLSMYDLTTRAGFIGMDLLFRRCNTIGYIRMKGITNQDSIISYALKLADRLIPFVCP